MQTNVVSAGIISGDLIIGLASGEIINAGPVSGPRGFKGDPGPPGPAGDPGQDGAGILNGSGPPQPDLGKDGDWYLQVDNTSLWGPKVGGRWQGPVFLLSEAARRDRIGGPMQAGRKAGGPSAFFGGTGATGAQLQQQPTQGLKPIIGHGQPFPATVAIKVAENDKGPLFEVELRAESATGVWVGSVRVGNYGNIVSHTVYGELLLGTPPVLTFTPSIAGGVLSLAMSSDMALTKLEGCQVILQTI